jgi:glycosyltransferase involved in cell wall biosynthesis
MYLSVVICTYNPKLSILEKVLDGLKVQSLDKSQWELIIVDNCSPKPLIGLIDLPWHPNARIITEKKAGLFHARIGGVKNAATSLIVFADDDNVLAADYLEKSLQFYQSHPAVGCFGGRSLPVYETEPPVWFKEAGINLGCQDYGPELYVSNYAASDFKIEYYPEKAPIGTGMVIQKKAFLTYVDDAISNKERMKLGRKGQSLSSGEDYDIILSLVKSGFEIAYVPELVVHHLIPSNRYSKEYLEKMAFESNRTWVKVLEIHGINPHKKIPKWTLLPRQIKSFITLRAWHSPLSAIRWKSSCGTFKGLSEL